MERNTKLFYLIAEAIEERPDLHDQRSFINVKYNAGGHCYTPHQNVFVAGRTVDCGTTQCIAGWATILEGRLKIRDGRPRVVDGEGNFSDFVSVGRELLGLNYAEANALFYTLDSTPPSGLTWPEVLRAIGDGADVIVALRGEV